MNQTKILQETVSKPLRLLLTDITEELNNKDNKPLFNTNNYWIGCSVSYMGVEIFTSEQHRNMPYDEIYNFLVQEAIKITTENLHALYLLE
jgi:hypothetical protein